MLSASFYSWLSKGIKGLIFLGFFYYSASILNPEEATVFMIMVTLISIQGIFDFGLIATFVRIISYVNNKNSTEIQNTFNFDFSKTDINEIYTVFEWIYKRLFIIIIPIFLIIGIFSLLNPIDRLENKILAWYAFLVSFVGVIFMLTHARFSSILTGYNLIPLQKKIEIYIFFPLLILIYIGIYLKLHFFWILLFFSSGYFILYLVTKRKVFRVIPELKIKRKENINLHLAREIFTAAWKTGLGILLTMGAVNFSAIYLGQVASPDLASKYLIAQRLIIVISEYAYIPFIVILPTISRLYAAGDIENLKRESLVRKKIVLSLTLALSSILFFFTEYFVPIFDESFSFVSLNIWVMLLMYSFLEKSGAMNLQIQMTNNNVHMHKINGIAGLLIFILFPMFYSLYGINGAPVSLILVFMFFYYPYSFYLLKREQKINVFKFDLFWTFIPLSILFLVLFY